MKREIKFRIYDPTLKKFSYFDLFSAGFNTPKDLRDNIQQFIEAIDKNGNDIYEGDIIKIHCTKKDAYNIEEQLGGFVELGEVNFSQSSGSYIQNKTDDMPIIDSKYMEIVGNIFENPELLN